MESFAPIWVTHPISGKEVNVAPLLHWLEQFDAKPDAELKEGAGQAVRRIIRAMNYANHNPDLTSPEQLIDLYVDLYRLLDMFEAPPSHLSRPTTKAVTPEDPKLD